jgi:outer membrane scaffolding protein for murein synthesis (MipA/OmpV family)
MPSVHRRHATAAAALCVALVSSAALADDLPTLSDNSGTPSDSNDFKLGGGGIETPAYLGSEARRKLIVPLFSATFAGKYYIGSSYTGIGGGVGMFLDKEPGFIWSLGLAGSQGRKEEYAPELAGMGDRPGGAYMDSGMSWRDGIFHVSGGIAVGLRGEEGSLGKIDVGIGGLIAPHWFGGFGINAVLVNAQQNNFDYGISDSQAAARAALIAAGGSTLRPGQAGPFTASGGLQRTGFGGSLSYLFDRHWSLSLFAGQAQLRGSALNSPLVSTDHGTSFGVFLAYRFSTGD